jgi:hypothetical protein
MVIATPDGKEETADIAINARVYQNILSEQTRFIGAVFDGQSTTRRSWSTRSRSSCRRWTPAMSSCWTISPHTNSPPCAPRSRPLVRSHGLAALQSRLQSDRAGVCQAEGLPARRAATILRSGLRADRSRARALHASRMSQLRTAVRLSCFYSSRYARSAASHLFSVDVNR